MLGLRNALIVLATIAPGIVAAHQTKPDYNGAYDVCKSTVTPGCGPADGGHLDNRPALMSATATPIQDDQWVGVRLDLSKPMIVQVNSYRYTIDGNNYREIIGYMKNDMGMPGEKWVLLRRTGADNGKIYKVELFVQDVSGLWAAQMRRLKPSAEGYATLGAFKFAPEAH